MDHQYKQHKKTSAKKKRNPLSVQVGELIWVLRSIFHILLKSCFSQWGLFYLAQALDQQRRAKERGSEKLRLSRKRLTLAFFRYSPLGSLPPLESLTQARLVGPKRPFRFVNFVLFTRDRILTNETQSNCFIPLSYSLIYIGCVKSYSAKFVRNHSLIRYSLHCDWLLPSTDLKGHSRLC